MKRLVHIAGLVLLPACGFDDVEETPQLLVPEDVEVVWDASFNGAGDGMVALVPVDLMVYDASSGQPLAFTELDVRVVGGADAMVLFPDEVVPSSPYSARQTDLMWDAWRDRWFVFAEESDSTAGDRVRTDAWGLARIYVMADAFPASGADGFDPIPVVVSMGITDDTFLLVPR